MSDAAMLFSCFGNYKTRNFNFIENKRTNLTIIFPACGCVVSLLESCKGSSPNYATYLKVSSHFLSYALLLPRLVAVTISGSRSPV